MHLIGFLHVKFDQDHLIMKMMMQNCSLLGLVSAHWIVPFTISQIFYSFGFTWVPFIWRVFWDFFKLPFYDLRFSYGGILTIFFLVSNSMLIRMQAKSISWECGCPKWQIVESSLKIIPIHPTGSFYPLKKSENQHQSRQ